MRLALVPRAERLRSSEEVANALRKELSGIPGVTVRTRSGQGLFIFRMISGGDRLGIEVRGNDFAIADELAARVKAIIEKVPGVTDARVSRESARPEEFVVIDRARAADLNLTVLQISETLQTALSGTSAGNFRDGDTEYSILVRLKDAERLDLRDVLDLTAANADLLLILGSRLDSRQTGTRPATFARGAFKVHVDIDPAELNAKLKADIAVQGDLKLFLRKLNASLRSFRGADLKPWREAVNCYRRRYPALESRNPRGNISPNAFMDLLAGYTRPSDIICLDVGQNQMWAGQSFRLKRGQRMLVSGGMGSMGFALPVAVGAALASGRRAVVITGDGGIQVNIQDLDSLPVRKLPVKIIMMNNGCLGMVRHFQDIYFGGRRQSTAVGYHCPDIGAIAAAYGVRGRKIRTMKEAAAVLEKVFSSDRAELVDVKLGGDTTVDPKLLVNHPIEDLSPEISREELAKEMFIKPIDAEPWID